MRTEKLVIGVGIIGLSAQGGWAATAHVPALRAMPERFSIVGLCGSSREAAEVAAGAHGVAFATADPATLAAHPEVDLVVVTVKVPHHRELAAYALDAGKAVYCEWPLGNSLGEAEKMAASAQERRLPAFSGLQGRSAPALRYLRDLVKEGFVGEVLSTNILGAGGFPWAGTASARTAYVTDVTTGATMLTIPFGHMIDTLSWILGGFERLRATLATRHSRVLVADEGRSIGATAPDQIAVMGVLSTGAVASLHYRGDVSPETNFRWEIMGTDGMILVEGDSGHLQYGHVRLTGRQGDEVLTPLSVPAKYRLVATDPAGYADALAHAYRAVYDDLRNNTSLAPTFKDAVENHRLLARIERAAQ
jgi:predicted dehydrogenase